MAHTGGQTRANRVDQILMGATDKSGCKITTVFSTTQNYAIYRSCGRFRIMFSDDPDTAAKQRLNYAIISPALARIQTIRKYRTRNILRGWQRSRDEADDNQKQQDEDEKKQPPSSDEFWDGEIARVVAPCLDGATEQANQIIAQLLTTLENLKQTESRLFYVIASAVLAFTYLIVALWLSHAACSPSDAACKGFWFFIGSNVVSLKATAFAALGGLFSVTVGVRSLKFEINSKWYSTVFFAGTRVVIAIISGLIVFVALDSGFVFTDLDNQVATNSGRKKVYLIAIVAGFSEQFVPNLLKKVEGERGAPVAAKPPGS